MNLVAFGNVCFEVSIILLHSITRLLCVIFGRVVLLKSIIGPSSTSADLGAPCTWTLFCEFVDPTILLRYFPLLLTEECFECVRGYHLHLKEKTPYDWKLPMAA